MCVAPVSWPQGEQATTHERASKKRRRERDSYNHNRARETHKRNKVFFASHKRRAHICVVEENEPPLLAKGPQFSTIFNFFFLLPHLFESSHKGFFFTLLNQVDLLSSSSSSFREKGGETVIYATPRLFVFFFLTSFPFFFPPPPPPVALVLLSFQAYLKISRKRRRQRTKKVFC